MPLFARRRLQSMLDDLGDLLDQAKTQDLLRRLEDKRVEQALPGEMELALLWALNQVGDLEIEPIWWGDSRRPDACSKALIPGRSVAIEIAAPSDNEISGEEAMDRVAMEISTFANDVQRGVGSYLYYRFGEESGYDRRGYYRRRLASQEFKLKSVQQDAIRIWIRGGASERLVLIDNGLHVEIERSAHKQTRYHNIFSSMPPETHSIEENPLFRLLKRKERQLKAAPAGVLRLLFLADAGSTLLNRLGTVGEIDPTHRRLSARQIISHFLATCRARVDGVVVFSSRRDQSWLGRSDLSWAISVFADPNVAKALEGGLKMVGTVLPKPRFEGYQARSLFRQGLYAPGGRGWYLGLGIETRMNETKIKLPARALLDFLAGRITEEQFRRYVSHRDGEPNLFDHWLKMGLTIAGTEMIPRSIDEDDDHLVLVFKDDPAARALRVRSEDQTPEG